MLGESHALLDDRVEMARLCVAGVRSTDLEHRCHHSERPFGMVEDSVEVRLEIRDQVVAVFGNDLPQLGAQLQIQLGEVHDEVQRVLRLVRDAGGECPERDKLGLFDEAKAKCAFGALARIQGAHQVIEGCRRPAELIVAVNGQGITVCQRLPGIAAHAGGDLASCSRKPGGEHIQPVAHHPTDQEIVHQADQEPRARGNGEREESHCVGGGHSVRYGNEGVPDTDGQPKPDHRRSEIPEDLLRRPRSLDLQGYAFQIHRASPGERYSSAV
ncbi:hypothetical protein MHEI_44080 [Mycobacterium heidelbergense]|nr:hypothetical protein MHEI_44080 [Mycobacterium heidelbergense]